MGCGGSTEAPTESTVKRAKQPCDSKLAELNHFTPLEIVVELPLHNSTDGVDRGVSIQFVLDFCIEHDLWEKPTWEVNKFIIQPACESGGSAGEPCRYVDLPSVVEKGVVGRAKTFVSHAWGASFGLIVVALLEGEPDMDRHVWIDIFAVLQFEPKPEGELRFDSVIPLCSSFLLVVPYVQEIADMDRNVAVAHDMKGISEETFRLLPMLRAWCLVEIFAALQVMGMVVVMKAGRLQRTDVNEGSESDDSEVEIEGSSILYRLNAQGLKVFLEKLFYVIDVAKAKATVEADRVRILEEHKDELVQVNAKVRGLCAASRMARGDFASSSLVSCAAMGDSRALTLVLEESDAEERRAHQRSCAGQGFVALLQMLLDSYPTEDREITLVVNAVRGGHAHCVQLLLQYKFDVNAVSINGTAATTACIVAADGGHTECLRLLLETRVCNIDAVNQESETACVYAAFRGHTECLRLLLEMGADVTIPNIRGGTACTCAATNGHLECLRLLLGTPGCDINAADRDNWTACMYAANGRHTECLTLLLQTPGCDVKAAGNDGWTVCMLVASIGHADCLRMILETPGCDINASSKDGDTACIRAASSGHTECLRLLLETPGCNMNAVKEGQTALFYARHNGHLACVELLESTGAKEMNGAGEEAKEMVGDAKADSDKGNDGVTTILNGKVLFDFLPLLKSTYRALKEFVLSPAEKGVLTRCYIERLVSTDELLGTRYSLCADLGDGTGRELIVCGKIKSGGITHFVFSLKTEDLYKPREERSTLYLGEMRALPAHTIAPGSSKEYVLYDSGTVDTGRDEYGDDSTTGEEYNSGIKESMLKKELLSIVVHTTVRPVVPGVRSLDVCIPNQLESRDGKKLATYNLIRPFQSAVQEKIQNENPNSKITVMHERVSEYDPLSPCLDEFDGRAIVASMKNFQLVVSYPESSPWDQELESHSSFVLQMAKSSTNCFNMDYKAPLSMLQAFAICVARLHAHPSRREQ